MSLILKNMKKQSSCVIYDFENTRHHVGLHNHEMIEKNMVIQISEKEGIGDMICK